MSEVSSVCPTCGSSNFFTKSSFDRHIRMHSVVVERGLWRDVCDICGKMFPNVVAFNDHVKKLHELQDYPCNQCDNKYKSANALQRHMKIHSPDQLSCDGCAKTFTRLDSLQRHKCKVPEFQVKCDHCLKVCPNERALKTHFKMHHEIEGSNIKCELCSAVFANNMQYKHHYTVLHKEFKYQVSDLTIFNTKKVKYYK